MVPFIMVLFNFRRSLVLSSYLTPRCLSQWFCQSKRGQEIKGMDAV